MRRSGLFVISLLFGGINDARGEDFSAVSPREPFGVIDADSLMRQTRKQLEGYARRELTAKLGKSFFLPESLRETAKEQMLAHLEQAKREVHQRWMEFLAKRVTDISQIDTIPELSTEDKAFLRKRYQEGRLKAQKK